MNTDSQFTLIFLKKPGFTGLALKLKKIGATFLNGYGGKFKLKKENPRAASLRELNEETGREKGITANAEDLEKVGIITFHNQQEGAPAFDAVVHIYFLRKWKGEPTATTEMGPVEWFPDDAIPLERMMLADRVWFPHVHAGKKIIGEVWYGPKQLTLLRQTEIRFVDNVPEQL